MSLDFVSLVPAGDDPLAQVVISKAAPVEKQKNPGTNTPHEYVNTDGEKHGETKCDTCGQAPDSPMHKAKRKQMNKSAEEENSSSTLNNNTSTEDHMPDINKSDLAPEVIAYIDALEDEIETLGGQIEKSEKSLQEKDGEIASLQDRVSKSGSVEDQEEINKSLLAKADPALRSLIEKQQADLARTQEIAKAEREARLEREYLAKAEEMSALPTEKASLATLLRRVADSLTPEENAEVEKMLRAANAQIAKSGLFGEFGKSAVSEVESSVEAQAAELQKADPTLTKDQAIVKVYENNPELAEKALNGEDN